MNLTFLGTSQAIPTRSRNHTAMLLRYGDETILVDCGEGTQRQFRKAGINPCKLTKLLITHWHGDHILGIPGLLQTLALNNYNRTLDIYGPSGTKRFIETMLGMFIFEGKIDIKIHEIDEGVIYNGKFILRAYRMEHGIKALAYSFEEKPKTRMDVAKIKKLGLKGPIVGKLQQGEDVVFNGKKILSKKVTYVQEGKKIAFIMDTALNENCFKAAEDADVLVCESTYMKKDEDKADSYKHLTAERAATIAKKSKAKALYLTHVSQRYEINEADVLKEAKKVFKNSFLPRDLDSVEI
ncbi:MAG: ribonuclease Z [Nanoarchaeota archaeon]|nr:ribonuclease Z [Nanoarchaeota archaeon]